MGKVGVLGHSFGAFTTLACLGASFDGGADASDGRFLCGVAYSPQGPGTLGSDKGSWGSLARPVMTFAGTADVSIGTTNPAERRIAYDSMPATGDKYHVTLSGATHDSFDDSARDGGRYHDCVERLTLAFFDSYLRGDPEARAWLKGESIEAEAKYAMQECK
jgi:predicted dienelactone hydrolase